jgi:hypothetical protein
MEKGEIVLDILSISKNQRWCMYIENIKVIGKPVICNGDHIKKGLSKPVITYQYHSLDKIAVIINGDCQAMFDQRQLNRIKKAEPKPCPSN